MTIEERQAAAARVGEYERTLDSGVWVVASPQVLADVWDLAREMVRLTDPTPFDEQWLRDVAGMTWDTNDPAWLVRGNVKCRNSFIDPKRWAFWVLGTKRDPAGNWAIPNPRTRGEVLWLFEQVNAENNHGQH